jgi:hypothetical protein
LLAGVTPAALGIPEVLGYAKIAGMPVVTGLYTLLLPMAVFAVLGSSRHLVVGADSATAAILAASLAGLAGSARYVQLAGLVALLAGGLLLERRSNSGAGFRVAPACGHRVCYFMFVAGGEARSGHRRPAGRRPADRNSSSSTPRTEG